MRIYQGRPFPISFYDRSGYKMKHYSLWWCLCNELDADPEGWIRIARQDMESIFLRTQQMKPTQLTSILKSLETGGYLEFASQAGARWFSVETYTIRIRPDAWEPRQIVKKQYPATHPRSYYRERKARLLAEALLAAPSKES